MDAVLTQQIPNDNSVVRQAGKEKWALADDNVTVDFDDELFRPRLDHPLGTGPEEFVSADWLEYFGGTLRQRLDQVVSAIQARGRTVGKQAKLAAVLVENVHAAAQKHNKNVDVRTTGEAADPSHSGIYGLDPTDHKIAQEIALHAAAYPAYK